MLAGGGWVESTGRCHVLLRCPSRNLLDGVTQRGPLHLSCTEMRRLKATGGIFAHGPAIPRAVTRKCPRHGGIRRGKENSSGRKAQLSAAHCARDKKKNTRQVRKRREQQLEALHVITPTTNTTTTATRHLSVPTGGGATTR